MTMIEQLQSLQSCCHCGMYHIGMCPRVKSVEYYPDGTIKRVEYHAAEVAAIAEKEKAK